LKKVITDSKILNLFKIGDKFTINRKPNSWSSAAGGDCPLSKIHKYPYTSEIVNIVHRQDLGRHIAILDNNDFGWSLSSLIDENKINTHNFERYKKLQKIQKLNESR
jgi:hypothetical protein